MQSKLERTLARAASLARDGYISRAAGALEGLDPAPNTEAVFEHLQGLHPPARHDPNDEARLEASTTIGIELSTDAVSRAPHQSKRAAAMYLQPLHLRVFAAHRETCSLLTRVCMRVLAEQVP